MKPERIEEIVERYDAMTDVFILCVDRDGVEGRRGRLDELEAQFRDERIFYAENAWEELETWVLAGLKLPATWRWADVRAEYLVKERYFDVLAKRRRVVLDAPGAVAASGWPRKPRDKFSAIRQEMRRGLRCSRAAC